MRNEKHVSFAKRIQSINKQDEEEEQLVIEHLSENSHAKKVYMRFIEQT